MKKKNIYLNILFYSNILIALVLFILFESNILLEGGWTEQPMKEFVVTYTMELLAIVFVWLSLRLLKFNKIQNWLFSNSEKIESRYFLLASTRILAIGLPLILNVLFYYLFINTTFAGLSAIHLLALMFVFPSKDRLKNDTTSSNNN